MKLHPKPNRGTSVSPRQFLTRLAILGLLCLPGVAKSAERLTLTNGFDMICDHHALVDGKIRVYLKAAKPDYVELTPGAVSDVEWVADPPPEMAADVGQPPADKLTNPTGDKALPARLTPADLQQLLAKAGSEHNVDSDLLASVVKAESGGNARAVSRTGARGLMQLMPGTAKQLGVDDSFAPEQNVRGGTSYLDYLLTRYHDNIALALAAYNAGPEAVDRFHGIPPYRETRLYVARVIHEFNRRVLASRRTASASPLNMAASIGSR